MNDLDIAKKVKLLPIHKIAEKFGIDEAEIEMYGKYKAKIPLHLIDQKRVTKAN
jgi:formate--tetrahydrofolate ligase